MKILSACMNSGIVKCLRSLSFVETPIFLHACISSEELCVNVWPYMHACNYFLHKNLVFKKPLLMCEERKIKKAKTLMVKFGGLELLASQKKLIASLCRSVSSLVQGPC